jgi:thiosulfate/3-mercaptopyruvate sulfurtransferase
MNDYLLEINELDALLKSGSVKLIDTRDEADYRRSHIPGACNVRDIFSYLCTRGNGSTEAMLHHFSHVFGRAGITPEDELVVYEDAMDNGYGQSCRGWFILSLLGHQKVRVLHGGYRAWLSKGLPVTSEVPECMGGVYPYQLNASLLVTAEQMVEAIDDPGVKIIDVRDYAEWIGANSSPYGYDFVPRKGRIPHAIWLEWYRLMVVKGGVPWFRSKEEVLDIAGQVGLTPETKLFVYCFKGARTSNTMLALKMAGFKYVRNYFNSWNEWSRDFSLPISEGYPQETDR